MQKDFKFKSIEDFNQLIKTLNFVLKINNCIKLIQYTFAYRFIDIFFVHSEQSTQTEGPQVSVCDLSIWS